MPKDHRPAKDTQEGKEERSPFERFVEAAYLKVSRAPFFFICALVVVLWFASVPLWANLEAWQYAIHTLTSVVTLLLLALLENAARRSEEAGQEKLNVIAEALAELMASQAGSDPALSENAEKLRRAVGLEERH